VYRNLNNGLISIQDLSTGLVLGHASAIDLQEASFIVREAGRQQVIKEKRKNVHAFVRGKVIDVRNFKPFKGRGEGIEDDSPYAWMNSTKLQRGSMMVTTTRVSYNPYKAPHFVTPEGDEVDYAQLCTIQSDGIINCYT
tara:strand:- start:385 stop:801 length:417 start_codon:yes stop_codon:yes gene_type:complete